MIEINGKFMCKGCFKELECKNVCGCGFSENPKDSLPLGTILNGRFLVGRQTRENKVVKEYLCYDSKNDAVVLIKEFFPTAFILRSNGTTVILENENNLDAYNASMQKFINLMQIPQSLSDPACFVKVRNAFYENNTAYFVIDNHSTVTVKEYVKNGRKMADKSVAIVLHSATKGLCRLKHMNAFNGNISASSVYVGPEGIKIDGFEPNEDDFAPYMKDSVMFGRTSYYMSPSDFSKKGKDIFSDVFSLGAVIYTLLTGKYPESPFECESQFDKTALENSTDDKQLVEIIKKMCRIDSCNYESFDSFVSDANKFVKKYGFKEIAIENGSSGTSAASATKKIKAMIVVGVIIAIAVAAVLAFVIKNKTKTPEGETTSATISTAIDGESNGNDNESTAVDADSTGIDIGSIEINKETTVFETIVAKTE